MGNIHLHSLFLTSRWCSPASGHAGELGGRVDSHTYPAEGVCLFLVCPGRSAGLRFSGGLEHSAGLWEHRFVPRKKMLHSDLYSAVPESSLPPSPSTFCTFSLLCSHGTSQGYTVLFVCLSSQCFSCWAVSSRAEILSCSLPWPQHAEYLSNTYELNEWLPGPALQGLQASCHSIGP